jgi:hypothetical protein
MNEVDLYNSGIKLGLNVNEIDYLMNHQKVIDEQSLISCGPRWPYLPGALYGAVSIYDF